MEYPIILNHYIPHEPDLHETVQLHSLDDLCIFDVTDVPDGEPEIYIYGFTIRYPTGETIFHEFNSVPIIPISYMHQFICNYEAYKDTYNMGPLGFYGWAANNGIIPKTYEGFETSTEEELHAMLFEDEKCIFFHPTYIDRIADIKPGCRCLVYVTPTYQSHTCNRVLTDCRECLWYDGHIHRCNAPSRRGLLYT